MFTIKPIQDKELQKARCTELGVPYYPDDMAYEADIDGAFTALSQFHMKSDMGYIDTLMETEGTEDFELMFILGRATMNFIDLCSTHHTCGIGRDAGRETLIKALGFKQNENGLLLADMTDMFSGCKGHGHCE